MNDTIDFHSKEEIMDMFPGMPKWVVIVGMSPSSVKVMPNAELVVDGVPLNSAEVEKFIKFRDFWKSESSS